MTVKFTYNKAYKNLASFLDRVTNDREVIIIQRSGSDVAMIATDELSSLIETIYLLRSPQNATRLFSSLGCALNNEGISLSLTELNGYLGLGEKKA